MFVHLLQDFMKEPIISQDVFLAIDKNKDGWIRILANFSFIFANKVGFYLKVCFSRGIEVGSAKPFLNTS